MRRRASPFARWLTAGLLLTTCLSAGCLSTMRAEAQTWNGATGDYGTASNWSPATVPTGASTTATFADTGATSLSLSSDVTIGTFQFDSNAQAYTIEVNGQTLQFSGDGIVNDSAATQTIRATTSGGSIQFRNTSSAGNATIDVAGPNLIFAQSATAGTATINVSGYSFLNFNDSSTLQNATVSVAAGSVLRFIGTSSGGQASVTLNGGSITFMSYTGSGTMLGSLAGTGYVYLTDLLNDQNKSLTIGGNNQSTTFSGVLTGDGSIVKEGTGTLTLSGDSNFSGGTTVTAGTLGVGHDRALGTGALSLSAGTTLQAAASATLGNAVTLNGATTVDTQTNTLTLNGAIDGTGGLTKSGTGTLVLGGANSYSGGTTVNGGTLSIAAENNLGATSGGLALNGATLRTTASFATTRAITIGGGTTISTDSGTTLTQNGAIGGGGGLTKSGSGTLVLGTANSYGGGTSIIGGTVSISANDNLGQTTGGVSLNGGTLQTTASLATSRTMTLQSGGGTLDVATGTTLTMAGNVIGSGGLTKTGSGTLTLSGSNTYGGATTVSQGTLAAGAANSFSSVSAMNVAGGTVSLLTFSQTIGSLAGASGTVQNGGATAATLTAGGNNTSTLFGGVLQDGGTGTLALAKTGSGTLTLSGTNTYSGGTTVSGGTLQGTTNSLQGDIVNNAQVTFSQTSTGTYAGSMSGTGALTKSGTGTVILSGTNSYTGGTTVSGGVLQGTTASLQGSIVNNAAVVFDQGTTGTYAGSMSGTGALTKSGTGTVILSGTNSYTGGTTVSGGVLQGTTASLQGSIVNNAAVVFDQAGNGTYAGSMSGTGALTKSGAGTVILSGTNSYTGGTTVAAGVLQGNAASLQGSIVNNATVVFDQTGVGTYSGSISGTGSLTKSGAGRVILSGTNSYAGGTTVSGGVLQGTTASLQGSIVNNAAVVFDQAGNGTYAGSMSGTGALTKSGAGTVILSGTNSYAGGTTVSGGVLQGTTASLQGNIVNNAAVVFDQVGNGAYAGAMSGTGALEVRSGGVILTGANSYTGGTAVSSSGILQGNTTSLQGNILNDAQVIFDQGTTGIYAGSMSGSGSLTKAGDGTLILSGTNSYAGGTTVAAGVLQGNAASLQGSIVNNATVVFDQTGVGTYSGNMSGTGSLTKSGAGTVILTGTNSYAGGTTVSGGALQGTTASLQGSIVNNGQVVFDQAGGGTYAGTMSGSGSLTLQGGGTLMLAGANTYTGGTTVNAGTLVVNGSLASTVTLNSGGRLGGSGSIGGLASNGGVLAPGNSIGTLTVTGSFVQSGGSYIVEANAAGQSDRVNVAGAATINGATVQVMAAAGSYARNTTYTILSASGGVGGAYVGVTSDLAFLTPSLSYDASNVFLTLALGESAFASGARSGNQQAVGAALDAANAGATGDFNTVLNALAGLNTQQGPWALNQISGQPIANFGTANLAANMLFMNAVGQQMALAREGARGSDSTSVSRGGQRVALAPLSSDGACEVEACDGASPLSAWMSAIGGLGSVQGNGNASTFSYNLGGAAAGIDYRVMPNLLAGIGVGYTSGTQWTDSFSGKGWSNAVSVTAYGSFTWAGFYLDALAGYAYASNQVQRQITVPGLQPRTASGSTGANQFLGQAEIGYGLSVFPAAQATVTPFARVQVATVNQAGFSEWGANSLSLNVAQQTTNSVRTTFGAELAGAVSMGTDRKLDLALRLGWLHEYADTARPMTASFAGAPSNAFTIYGATPVRDSAVIGFSANTRVADNASIFVRYDGELAAGTDNHTLNAGFRLSW